LGAGISGLGDWSARPNWNGWGASIANTRFQSAEGAQLAPEAVSRLKLKWAFGFPGAKAVYGQPTVAGGRVFLGVDTGSVYSIDASTGCMYWMYKAAAAVRSAVSVGPGRTPGEHLAYFGDLAGNAYALNAATGEQVWNPITAYQITSMLQGVVQRGTATAALSLGRPVGGNGGSLRRRSPFWPVRPCFNPLRLARGSRQTPIPTGF